MRAYQNKVNKITNSPRSDAVVLTANKTQLGMITLHGGFLESMVTLICLRQNTRVSFMGWLDTPSFVSGLNAWIVVFGVGHEEYLEVVELRSYVGTIPTWLASYFLV